ncbi:unnamed protein product, partial [Heligmosomoides polygyrus]|uniref:CCHC-type domain-containing protein n=1 Tax=Heligmosomoides polygyrus TaxID=6339 RepID=A0A183F8G6_HELPZ
MPRTDRAGNESENVGATTRDRNVFDMTSQRERSVMGRNVEAERKRNGGTNNANRKCYNCSNYGHIGRECPRRAARVNQIMDGSTAQPKSKETEPLSAIIDRVRSMGVQLGKGNDKSPPNDLIGERMVAPVRVLGSKEKALLDTGSMISIVPVELLARARDRKVDVDSFKFLEKSKLTSVHDASGNRMDFLGAVYLEVELEGGRCDTVAFHISVTKEEELIIGTNALQRLGVEMVMKGPSAERVTNRVAVTKRVYVPPREVQTVQVCCEGDLAEAAERVIWPERRGIAAGVYAIKGQRTELPMFNTSDEPVLLKEGESVGYWSTDKWHDRGVTIVSSTERGHLQYTCGDGCFARVTLADVKRVTFPGAYGRQPVSDLWTAWKMASIFIRNDITVAQKIQYQMERAVILDAGALCSVLRLAYEVCTDWTVFLCTSKEVATHAPIDGNCITDFYRAAFEQFRKDLKEESRAARRIKQGPVGFAAPETALLLERDGPRGGIITKVVITYTGLKETLANWKTFAIWVIVWPLENRGQEDIMKEIVDLARSHLDDGGRIVTAWPPVTAPKETKWKSMRKIWKTLDDVIAGYGTEDQVALTASNFVSDNKIFLEAGTPEAAAQF